MPARKQPKSLLDIGIKTFVNHFINVWLEHNNDVMRQVSIAETLEFLPQWIPSVVADRLVCQAINSYIKLYNCGTGDDLPSITLFLQSVLVPQLRHLDLSNLIKLGIIHDDYFEYTISSTLPLLSKLVTISLRTHGRDITLPVCNNHTLELIGKHCPNLKSLDVSNNSQVSDTGLKHLIPCLQNPGCPLLEEFFFYECNISQVEVAHILRTLCNLSLIGYKEMGLALTLLHNQLTREKCKIEEGLKLTLVNNVGSKSYRRENNVSKLKFNDILANTVKDLCPNLRNLKVRVADCDLARFPYFPRLSLLELTFNVSKPASPGEGAKQFISLQGAQLDSLTIICDVFYEEHIVIIGENCPLLKQLWLRCNGLNLSESQNKSSKHTFSLLKSFYFHIGETEDSVCTLPVRVMQSVLQNTDKLEELKLIARTESISNEWMSQLISSVNTTQLRNLLIAIPRMNIIRKSVDLSISSVHAIVDYMPRLEILGNLFVWNVNIDDVHNQLRNKNSDLKISCRPMKIN